ncbi:MAG: hypothetical protein ABR601_01020 [Parasphingopyxis sp.]|nr:hypothetical protein [Sphingomonadales bacterium]
MTDFNGAYVTGLFDKSNDCVSGNTAGAMAASVMTDYVFWSVHVSPQGDLGYNNVSLASGGQIVAETVNCLKAVADAGRGSGELQRVWLSIGAGGTSDFTNIADILNATDGRRETMLANFAAVANALGACGFDYDNEDQIGNVEVITGLTAALYGDNSAWRFSFCPYGNSSYASQYWIQCLQAIFKQLGTQPVVGFNLQCYSGGSDSDPDGWQQAVEGAGSGSTGITDANALIRPGLSVTGGPDPYTPSEATSALKGWNSSGGWIWNSEIVLDNPSDTIADYGQAIAAGT